MTLGGGLRTVDEVKKAFDLGVYRARIGTMLIQNPDEAKKLIDLYGPSRIILGIDAMDGIVATKGWVESSGLTAMTVALNAKALGRMVSGGEVCHPGLARQMHGLLRDPGFAKDDPEVTGLFVVPHVKEGGHRRSSRATRR